MDDDYRIAWVIDEIDGTINLILPAQPREELRFAFVVCKKALEHSRNWCRWGNPARQAQNQANKCNHTDTKYCRKIVVIAVVGSSMIEQLPG